MLSISFMPLSVFVAICSFSACCQAWVNTCKTISASSGPSNAAVSSIAGPSYRSQSRTIATSRASSPIITTNTNTILYNFEKSKDMLEFIEEPMTSREMVGDKPPIGPPELDPLADLVKCIVKAADARKADNIVALRVSKISTVTSFIVMMTGNSRPQNQAIAASIKDDVQEFYNILPGSTGVPEGSPDSGWTVLDYGSVMVHVMTPKSRLFYNVEGQWKDKQGCEYMNLNDVILPNNPVSIMADNDDNDNTKQKAGTMQGLSREEDPFWS